MNKLNKKIYLIFLSAVIVWCILFSATPIIRTEDSELGDLLQIFFSRICHQIDNRCFYIGDYPFPVCMRCSAIYLSFLTSLLLYPLFRQLENKNPINFKRLVLAAIPMILDVFLGFTGIHHSDSFTRIITGVIAGFTLPYVIVPILLDGVSTIIFELKGESNNAT